MASLALIGLTIATILQAQPLDVNAGKKPTLPPLEVSAFARRSNHTAPALAVFVTLENRDPVNSVTDVVLSLDDALSVRATKRIPKLSPFQSAVEQFCLLDQGQSLILVVSYSWNNEVQSVAGPVNGPDDEEHMLEPKTLTPAILGLFGVAVGAWLTNLFARRRELYQSKVAWGQLLFEKYEKAYRDFLARWGTTAVPLLLRAEFELLMVNSVVPSRILAAYKSTLDTLESVQASADDKEKACRKLRETIEEFVFSPWGEVSSRFGSKHTA